MNFAAIVESLGQAHRAKGRTIRHHLDGDTYTSKHFDRLYVKHGSPSLGITIKEKPNTGVWAYVTPEDEAKYLAFVEELEAQA